MTDTPNMNYCKYENTLAALQQCYNKRDTDEDLSDREEKAKNDLLDLCANIKYDFSDDDDY